MIDNDINDFLSDIELEFSVYTKINNRNSPKKHKASTKHSR